MASPLHENNLDFIHAIGFCKTGEAAVGNLHEATAQGADPEVTVRILSQ
jgi:hypothetical protein